MKILSYSYRDYPVGWNIPTTKFNDLNLIVGISGAGKTRLLNTISNIKRIIIEGFNNTSFAGSWDLTLQENDQNYHWKISSLLDEHGKPKIVSEYLSQIDGETEKQILNRDDKLFTYKDQTLPKLSNTESAISLLKNEEEISILFSGFDRFLRRELSIPTLQEAAKTHMITFNEKEKLKKEANLYQVINIASLNDRLDIIKNSFHEIFDEICNYFISIFPFVKRVDIKKQTTPFGLVPVFCIKEKNVDDWIPLSELSSGMQKIVFMLTDICSLPEGSVYFIDEYENSLGINAINIIPELLVEYKHKIQFFITSHHPYLINNVPVENWYVCYRSGQNVNIKYGSDLEKRYGSSKQKAFVNLMNDPLYSEGVE